MRQSMLHDKYNLKCTCSRCTEYIRDSNERNIDKLTESYICPEGGCDNIIHIKGSQYHDSNTVMIKCDHCGSTYSKSFYLDSYTTILNIHQVNLIFIFFLF